MGGSSLEIYRSQDGSVELNVTLEKETVWLTQGQMATYENAILAINALKIKFGENRWFANDKEAVQTRWI